MARTRNIKPGFFLNDVLGECEPLGRLLFAGLWCQADRNGVVEYRPRRIKAEILPFDDADIEGLVVELEARGFVVRFAANGSTWLRVVKFREHQTPHPREPAIEIPEENAKPGIFAAGHLQAQALLGGRQDEPGHYSASAKTSPDITGRAPEQAGFPTPSSFSTSLPPSASSVASPADAGSPQQVLWASQTGWQGITAPDRSEWRSAFPAVDIDAELAASGLWLKANPHKAKRTNWRKFIVGWLKNAQDKGGTRRGYGAAGGQGPPPASKWDDESLKRLEMTRRKEQERYEKELST
jgi:hypothetical protein